MYTYVQGDDILYELTELEDETGTPVASWTSWEASLRLRNVATGVVVLTKTRADTSYLTFASSPAYMVQVRIPNTDTLGLTAGSVYQLQLQLITPSGFKSHVIDDDITIRARA